MMILMRALSTIVLTKGVFLLVGTIHGFVDQALFLKGTQGAVQSDAVYLAQMLLKIILR